MPKRDESRPHTHTQDAPSLSHTVSLCVLGLFGPGSHAWSSALWRVFHFKLKPVTAATLLHWFAFVACVCVSFLIKRRQPWPTHPTARPVHLIIQIKPPCWLLCLFASPVKAVFDLKVKYCNQSMDFALPESSRPPSPLPPPLFITFDHLAPARVGFDFN